MRKTAILTAALALTLAVSVSLSGCDALSGDVREISGNSGATEITETDARQLVLGMVPGSEDDEITSFKEGFEESNSIYKGKLKHEGITYEFKIDSANGNMISWMVTK